MTDKRVPEISKALRAFVEFLDYADDLLQVIAENEGRNIKLERGAQLDLQALADWFEANPEIATKIDQEVLKHWYLEEMHKRN